MLESAVRNVFAFGVVVAYGAYVVSRIVWVSLKWYADLRPFSVSKARKLVETIAQLASIWTGLDKAACMSRAELVCASRARGHWVLTVQLDGVGMVTTCFRSFGPWVGVRGAGAEISPSITTAMANHAALVAKCGGK